MRTPATLILLGMVLMAQDPPPPTNAPVLNAAVSGIVRDRNTGKPLAGYTVSTTVGATWIGNTVVMSAGSKDVKSSTDETGRYRLADLPAAPYMIMARNSHGGFTTVEKSVVLDGHDINDLNFDFTVDGAIKGRVLDENKEPVPGVAIHVVSRQYFLGSVGYFLHGGGTGRTNDRGEFSIEAIPAGQPFYLLADQRAFQLPAHSETPLNPKLRRRIPMRTWFPNSPSKDGAAPVILRAGEVREGVDIEMRKSPNLCVEGTLLTGAGGPAALNFSIEPLQPSSGINESGGTFMAPPFGTTGSDGAFRICDLYPGAYRIQASLTKGDLLLGVATVNIADQDVKGIKIAALPAQPIEGEVVLDGPVPVTPLPTKVSVNLQPLLRTQMPGERSGLRAEIPGPFTIPAAAGDDFMARIFVNGPGLYLKDILWAGASIRYQPLRVGTSAGSGLRVVIGQDGAKLTAVVTDKDGNPVPDLRVVVYPAEIASEAVLSAAMLQGQTNQYGQYTSQTLAPGKYYVGAIDAEVDHTVESIARLWRSRNRFTEVDVAPNGTPRVTLSPVVLAP
jgi:hypothetical protein